MRVLKELSLLKNQENIWGGWGKSSGPFYKIRPFCWRLFWFKAFLPKAFLPEAFFLAGLFVAKPDFDAVKRKVGLLNE